MTASARATALLVERILASMRSGEGVLRQVKWGKEIVDLSVAQAMAGDNTLVPRLVEMMKRTPVRGRGMLVSGAQDSAVRRLWQAHRITHVLDPDAWDAIGAADPGATVPPDVLAQLPYPDPLVVFPEPILLDNGGRERQRVVAMFVTGIRQVDGHTLLCSTSSLDDEGEPLVEGWALTFVGFVETTEGRPVRAPDGLLDLALTRSSLWLREPKTLRELTDVAIDNFRMNVPPDMMVGDHRKDLPVLLARAVNMIFYLCAKNADLRQLPALKSSPARARSRSGPARPKPPKVVEVGFRVGAALREWHRSEPQRAAAATGRTVAPHVRRSHPHTYRYGPGRSQAYIRWMWPIPINMGAKGTTEKTTVIAVPGKVTGV